MKAYQNFTLSILLILPLNIYAAGANLKEARVKTAKILLDQGSLRKASCRNFANTILDRAGLPEVGKKGSDIPNRSSFDRTQENAATPVFTDGLASGAAQGTLTTSITAANINKSEWEISLHRKLVIKKEEILADSNFLFKIEDNSQESLCTLESFTFLTHPKVQKATHAPVITVEECLDLFLNTNDSSSPSVGIQALGWLKTDCALNIRYSPETQKIVKDSPK